MGLDQAVQFHPRRLADLAAAGQAAGRAALTPLAQAPDHIDQCIAPGQGLEAPHIGLQRQHRAPGLLGQAFKVAGTQLLLHLAGQGVVELIHQRRAPALGFEDRQGAAVLAHHQLRLVHLDRNPHRGHFELRVPGAGRAAAFGHRWQQGVVMGGRGAAGGKSQGQAEQQGTGFHGWASGTDSRTEEDGDW